MDYNEVEPFGEQRAELRNGVLCSFIGLANDCKKEGGERFQAADFMSYTETPKEKQLTEEEKEAELDKIFR
ncbi:MAG: hypothetical protein KJ630_19100 [Proteobacteria bacterium]|nr:hypothetical protein [Pseudomonadota bacterium]